MFQQCEKLGQFHPRAAQFRDLPQQPSRRGEVQRLTGAVIGDQAPPVERGGHLPGQHAVGSDKRGALPVFDRLP